jgi:hypothetical protein
MPQPEREPGSSSWSATTRISERGKSEARFESRLQPGVVIMNLTLVILREFFEMVCSLKKLFSILIDGDPLDNGPNSCACR